MAKQGKTLYDVYTSSSVVVQRNISANVVSQSIS